MDIPRIRSLRTPVILEQFASRWPFRYAIALVGVALSALLSLTLGDRLGVEFYLVMLFATVFITSVMGGLGPGLVAITLAAWISNAVPQRSLSLDEMRLFVIEAALVSVGGTFRAGLIKARDGFKTELQLQQQILEINDEERRRIGNDLHDGLGQHLTGISLMSETILQQLESGGQPNPAHVETITRLVGEAVGITRDLAKSLSPITIEVSGLSAALAELAETYSSLFGVQCECEADGQLFELDQKRSLHLFRIVQEAINNSVRHGKAKNIQVRLVREKSLLKVTVVDDGIGLSKKTSDHPGVGLRIMQQRAKMLIATLTVERASAEGGTVVTCICPIDG